ncbi:MAG TPA: hypothetical protein VFB12_28150, partial [Ktedonobacteraceae bacterium]|nr:hypothetical protein [Ktedonobacteraceae bacterium]
MQRVKGPAQDFKQGQHIPKCSGGCVEALIAHMRWEHADLALERRGRWFVVISANDCVVTGNRCMGLR